MRIELVVDPSKPLPLASRVTPAVKAAAAAKLVILRVPQPGHLHSILGLVLVADVDPARTKGLIRRPPTSMPRWRFVINFHYETIVLSCIQDYTSANGPAPATA